VKRVLLAEDDAFYRQQLSELLTDQGLSVEAVSTPKEALERLEQSFDCAIFDVMLPNDESVTGISNVESWGGYRSGIALARRARESSNVTSIILLSGASEESDARTWAEQNGVVFVSKTDGRSGMYRALSSLGLIAGEPTPLAFIVHGHDDQSLLELKDFIQNSLGWRKPIVLREEPNSGRTIIEKFESTASSVDWVFVLLTPDDEVRSGQRSNDQKRRARQNVIFEMGYFFGKLDRLRGRLVALVKGEIELPTDISGIVYIQIDQGIKSAGEEIRREVAQLRPGLGR
jgi:CheY-like chemotaxis protein